MQETQQLNIQMSDTDTILTPLQKLNLMDAFLFDVKEKSNAPKTGDSTQAVHMQCFL